MFTGAKVFYLEETTSTNEVAAQMLSAGSLMEGSLVITSFQSKGKGQRGNNWQSNKGENLLMSLILLPDFLEIKNIFYLNMCIALGVYDYVSAHTQTMVCIKWPNDILVDKKKIAGILIENNLKNSCVATTIAGVGVNLNQQEFGNGLQCATSVKNISGKNLVAQQEALILRDKIQFWYKILKEKNFDAINIAYHQRLFGLDEMLSFTFKDKLIDASIRGVDKEGRLVLEKNNGEFIFPLVKEIEYVRD